MPQLKALGSWEDFPDWEASWLESNSWVHQLLTVSVGELPNASLLQSSHLY